MFSTKVEKKPEGLEWGCLPDRREFISRYQAISGMGFAMILGASEWHALRTYRMSQLRFPGLVFVEGEELYGMLEEIVEATPAFHYSLGLRGMTDWNVAMCIVETVLAVYGYRWIGGTVGQLGLQIMQT